MQLPHITEKQKEILKYLYQFRYLHTNHIQNLFNHKDKTTVKVWLKDLREKGFIHKIESEEESFIDRSKPNIYCLAPMARQILKYDEESNATVLDRIYKEKKREQKFIKHCLSIADVYLFFISQKEAGQEIEFFTETELVSYKFFPHPKPSAYISITSNEGTQRYFLDYFDPYTPPFVYRKRINYYLDYANSGDWEANSGAEPLPSILFICPTKNIKSHVYKFTKSKFEKAFEETLDLYLTTWESLKPGNNNIWEKVEY